MFAASADPSLGSCVLPYRTYKYVVTQVVIFGFQMGLKKVPKASQAWSYCLRCAPPQTGDSERKDLNSLPTE